MRFPGTMMVQTGFDPAEDHIGPFYFEPKGTAAFGVMASSSKRSIVMRWGPSMAAF